MKRNAICLAMACFLAAACFGARQAATDETQRFKVLRAGRLVAPSESVTNTDAHCAIAGSSDEATMKCQPAAATQGSSYHYHTALVVDAEGTAYVIACRVSLVTNFWCKGLAPGTAFQGRLAQGNLAIADGDKSHDYKLLTSAYVGPLPGSQPAALAQGAGSSVSERSSRGSVSSGSSSSGSVGSAPARAEPPTRATGSDKAAAGKPVGASLESTAKDSGGKDSVAKGSIPSDSNGSCAPSADACVTFVSEPQGADIYVDGKFVGNTPSVLNLAMGSHEIRIESEHFKPWTRTLETSAGSKITIRAPLQAAAPAQ
jgi:PEGA domain